MRISGAAVESFQDLDALPLAQRELPDPRLRVNGHLETLRGLGDRLLDCAGRNADVGLGPAEHDVLRHRHAFHKTQMLVNHEDAGVLGVFRGVEPHGATGDRQLPFVGAVKTHEEIAKRGLAGSVLTEQRVHLARGCLERHAIVRDDPGEALGHVDGPHRQCPRHRAGGIVRGS